MAGSDQSNRRRQYPEFPDRFYNKVALANRHERTKFKVSNYSTSVPFKADSDQSNRRRQYLKFPDLFYNKVAPANRLERTKFKVSNY